MGKITINNWVDWGKSFVDKDGSYYARTTEEEKDLAVEISKEGDLWIYLVDVHTRGSTEFIVNEGDHQTHNLVKKDWYDLDKLGVEPGKTVSPELTEKLNNLVKELQLPSGLIVPRHVFFQDFDGKIEKPDFSFKDVEDTFGVKRLNATEFLDGKIKYVINAKHTYDGSAIQSTEWMGYVDGVPTMETNIFTLLKQKYGQGKDLIINHTGVVMGICIYQTATGIKQKFPKAEVNIIADASTHLLVPQLGFAEKDTADLVIKKMCTHLGVNYISCAEYLGKGK